jgi:hypothetical protein
MKGAFGLVWRHGCASILVPKHLKPSIKGKCHDAARGRATLFLLSLACAVPVACTTTKRDSSACKPDLIVDMAISVVHLSNVFYKVETSWVSRDAQGERIPFCSGATIIQSKIGARSSFFYNNVHGTRTSGIDFSLSLTNGLVRCHVCLEVYRKDGKGVLWRGRLETSHPRTTCIEGGGEAETPGADLKIANSAHDETAPP